MAGGVSVGGGECGLTQNTGRAGRMDGGAARPLVYLSPNDTPRGTAEGHKVLTCVSVCTTELITFRPPLQASCGGWAQMQKLACLV